MERTEFGGKKLGRGKKEKSDLKFHDAFLAPGFWVMAGGFTLLYLDFNGFIKIFTIYVDPDLRKKKEKVSDVPKNKKCTEFYRTNW